MKQHLTIVPPSPADSDTSFAELDIGLPLTGRCGLAEGPLLQLAGDLQWRAISRISGAPIEDIRDREGERLYATFFYAEARFSQPRPMAAFGESERVTVATDLTRFGVQLLEGRHYLLSRAPDGTAEPKPETPKAAARGGVPFVRLTNNFVRKSAGPTRLVNARPVNEGIERIPRKQYPPVGYLLIKKCERYGGFFKLADEFVPLTEQPRRSEYEIVPDRDLNGAGLLYFANYPVVLDICERRLLGDIGRWSLSSDLLDNRTVVHRRSAYYGNAGADETLLVEMSAWIRNPFAGGDPDPEATAPELRLEFRMTRASDRQLMMVSSVKKTIWGTTLADTDLIDPLSSAAGR